MNKERFWGQTRRVGPLAAFVAVLAIATGCGEKVNEEPRVGSPTPPRPIPTRTTEATVGVSTPFPPAEARATGAPRPAENRAAMFDGKNDALQIESGGILLTGPFRIEANVNLKGVLAGGDTIVSKGDGFAVFARSLRCLGNVGLLLDGQDICTEVKLGLNTWNKIVVDYDGNEATFTINDQQPIKKTWKGPLQISSADLMIARRPGVLREPLTASVDALRIFDDGRLVADLPFDQDFADHSDQRRKVTILGDPKLEVVR